MASPRAMRREAKRLRRYISCHKPTNRFDQYRLDPASYCKRELGVELTAEQKELAGLAVTPPYRVLAPAGHNVGKSFFAGCMINWWYDCFNPGIVLTTAPTDRQVRRILWKEVRLLRGRRGGFAGPKIPLLWSAENHFAEGFTAREATRFQGQHGLAVMIVFDEAEGVEQEFWEAAEPMLGGDNYCFLGIYNPTSQSGPTVDAERSGRYHLRRLSCLDHPNIREESEGRRPLVPSAIRLGRLLEMLEQWSEELPVDQQEAGDVVVAGRCFRPGPIAQARLLGVRPSTAFNAVWSELVFDLAATTLLPLTGILQVGCDVARFGDDFTSFHVRLGGVSLYHESVNGWDTVKIAERCKQLAHEYGGKFNRRSQDVPICVDVCGVGGGVVDVLRNDGWAAIGVNVGEVAPDPDIYPNLRSALWFGLANEAKKGNVSLIRMPDKTRAELRRQLLAPLYTLDTRGRMCVESKDQTKARLNRSPDDADGLLLAYANVRHIPDRVAGRVAVPS